MMNNILQVVGLKKYFSKRLILDNINLDVEYDDILGIVGESGCGKTTLAKIIVGLIKQDSGKIFYKKNDVSEIKVKNSRILREIQIVFQDPFASLNPKITVYSTLREVLVFNGVKKIDLYAKAVSSLKDVGLEKDFLFRYPSELSGGQAQRICIARSLAADPKLLILDEPLSSLDFDLQEDIIDLLMQLKNRKSLTYVFITHDLHLAKKICNKISVMRNGKILEFGETERIFNFPKEDYTKQLLDDII